MLPKLGGNPQRRSISLTMVRRAVLQESPERSFKTGLVVLFHHQHASRSHRTRISLVCISDGDGAPSKHHRAITMSQIAHLADQLVTDGTMGTGAPSVARRQIKRVATGVTQD